MTTTQEISAGSTARNQVTVAVLPERMPEIPEGRMTEAQKQAAAELVAGSRGDVRGPFVALLRSPEFMRRVQKVGEYIRFICPLDKRINEFAAIIAARHWSQQFEWWAHYRQALAAGLKGVIDVLGVVGYYALLAMVMNVARTAVPEGSPLPLSPLPERAQSQ